MSTTAHRTGYAGRLERAMAAGQPPVSVRALSRELRPDSPESMRRLIRRFLNGERTPGPQVAGEIVAALGTHGVDTAELESDDEESDEMARDPLDLCAQLEAIGQRLAERLHAEAA